MDVSNDVRLLQKFSKFGLLNPLHDRERLGGIAEKLDYLGAANEQLKVALNLAMRFITDHLGDAHLGEREAAALILAIQEAVTPRQVERKLIDRSYSLDYDSAANRADMSMPTVIERTMDETVAPVVTAYHAATFDWRSTEPPDFDYTRLNRHAPPFMRKKGDDGDLPGPEWFTGNWMWEAWYIQQKSGTLLAAKGDEGV